MKKIFNGKIILYLMLFSPLIDIITSVMLYNGINFTLGIFIKCIMIFLSVVYLLFIDKSNRKINYIIIALLSCLNMANIINNIDAISDSMFNYFSYLIKYDFIVLLLLFFIKYFMENRIEIKLLKIPIIILSISIILSNLTNTAFYTYDAFRNGTSSWFSSGNEFGAILSIMYPIAIYLFLDRKDSKKIDIIYVIIIAYGMLNLGTKVGLLSFIISSLCYLFFRIINKKKYKLNYSFYAIILLLVIVGCLFNNLPTVKNVKNKYDYVKNNLELTTDEKYANAKAASEVILSNRNEYFAFIRKNNYNISDYLTGKINLSDKAIVLIEMDILDVFYMFGIFGFILLYGMIGYIAFKIIIKYLSDIKNGIKYIKINMLIVCLVLTFLISCIVGHVIFCPSVSIYFVVICSYMYAYDKFEKEENAKIKILFGAVHMKIGGIERTLINLLKSLNYDKYEVDLFLQLENGEFYNDTPQEVKIITPYSKIFKNFFANESKISKIIKHLLYNKYTAWLWTNNKSYDVAIDYTGYYLFIDYYIAKSNSNKKYIWVHQNVYGSLRFDKNFNRNFLRNIKKYNYFDKIVCVSNSTKKDFDLMFPNLKDKTKVVFNMQDSKIDKTENVELDGKYKIISVGRMCAQKSFSRLIKVHKKLIDDGYAINTYIIGDGEEYDELLQLIKKLEVSDTCKLVGKKKNIYDYLKQADLFVITSETETFATVLFESLACNLPWVGPKVSGVIDVYSLSPKGSCILTENTIEDITKGVEEAIDGKVTRYFKFDVDKHNKKVLKQFYRLIGD